MELLSSFQVNQIANSCTGFRQLKTVLLREWILRSGINSLANIIFSSSSPNTRAGEMRQILNLRFNAGGVRLNHQNRANAIGMALSGLGCEINAHERIFSASTWCDDTRLTIPIRDVAQGIATQMLVSEFNTATKGAVTISDKHIRIDFRFISGVKPKITRYDFINDALEKLNKNHPLSVETRHKRRQEAKRQEEKVMSKPTVRRVSVTEQPKEQSILPAGFDVLLSQVRDSVAALDKREAELNEELRGIKAARFELQKLLNSNTTTR